MVKLYSTVTSLPRAEDLNYWRTSRKSPDEWICKAKSLIESVGGDVHGEAFANTKKGQAYRIDFSIDGDEFRLTWPVCIHEPDEEIAARRQAATMLFHDVKSRVVAAKVMGLRAAFLPFLMLPGGRAAGFLASPELEKHLPKLITG